MLNIPIKFTNCIYILSHEYAFGTKLTNKIGSSKILPGRMSSYKTYYPDDKHVIGYFYIHNYDCYQLDDNIKIKFNDFRIKSNGGIEYYSGINPDRLKEYFDSSNIKYDYYTDNDFKNISVYDYQQLEEKTINEQIYFISKNFKSNYDNQAKSELKLNLDTKQNIELKLWQKDLVINWNEFIESDKKTGIIIAPTGCGKSFMIRYLSIFAYINLYKNDVIIMTKRKEIFDSDFIKETERIIELFGFKINIISLIDGPEYTHEIFNNQSSYNNIYIINNDKFISSYRFNKYFEYSWGKIKLLILDESHWAGAKLFTKFLKYMKDNIVDKIIGFSATPVRTAYENKLRTLNIFSNGINKSELSDDSSKIIDDEKLNDFTIIYQRSYIESIEEGDRVPNKWLIIPIKSNGFNTNIIESNEELELLESKLESKLELNTESDIKQTIICKQLNDIGIECFLQWLNKFIKKSIRTKGILWFGNKKGLKQFYKFVTNLLYLTQIQTQDKQTNNYDNIKDIQFIPTYSKSSKNVLDDMDTSGNIDKFKKLKSNGILLAVMRATEGFDAPSVDFGFNLFITESTNGLLDQQKEGRVGRNYEDKTDNIPPTCGKKKIGYYGFLVDNPECSNIETNNNYRNKIIMRLGDWIRYVNEYQSETFNSNTKPKPISDSKDKTLEYTDIIIDDENIQELNFADIKTQIHIYSDRINISSSIGEVRRHMQKINKYKLKNNTNDLIDTEAKYKSYAELNGLPLSEQLEMKIYSYNWIKFLRPDYEEYVKNYYNPIQLKELKVKNINEYIKRLLTDNKIPSVELINNGLFNISNEHFNLENIYHIVKKKKY